MRPIYMLLIAALIASSASHAKSIGDTEGGYSFEVPDSWVRMDKGEQFFIRPPEQLNIVEYKLLAESQAREKLEEVDDLLTLVSARFTLGYKKKGEPGVAQGLDWKGLITPFEDKDGRVVFQLALQASKAERVLDFV